MPGPHHFLAKLRFSSAREGWAFLDSRPDFPGKGISIERARAEAVQQRRPIMEAYRLIKEHLADDMHTKLRMDAGRGIVWLCGARIFERVGTTFKWTMRPRIADAMDALQNELLRRLASTRGSGAWLRPACKRAGARAAPPGSRRAPYRCIRAPPAARTSHRSICRISCSGSTCTESAASYFSRTAAAGRRREREWWNGDFGIFLQGYFEDARNSW